MRRSERWNAVGWLLLSAALLLGAGMLLSGCTRTVYEPVEHTVVRTDTVYAARFAVDSIELRSTALQPSGTRTFSVPDASGL